MPITVVCLTDEECQGLLDRLKALEASQATRMTDLAPVLQRIQGLESTVLRKQLTAAVDEAKA